MRCRRNCARSRVPDSPSGTGSRPQVRPRKPPCQRPAGPGPRQARTAVRRRGPCRPPRSPSCCSTAPWPARRCACMHPSRRRSGRPAGGACPLDDQLDLHRFGTGVVVRTAQCVGRHANRVQTCSLRLPDADFAAALAFQAQRRPVRSDAPAQNRALTARKQRFLTAGHTGIGALLPAALSGRQQAAGHERLLMTVHPFPADAERGLSHRGRTSGPVLWVDQGAICHSTAFKKRLARPGLPVGAASTFLKQRSSEQTPPITNYDFSLCATTRPSALTNTR
jgi:hypothetical protein